MPEALVLSDPSFARAEVQLKQNPPTPLTDITSMDSASFVYEVVLRGIDIESHGDPFGEAAYARIGGKAPPKSAKPPPNPAVGLAKQIQRKKTDRTKARARFRKVFNGVVAATAPEDQRFLCHSQIPSKANLDERDIFLSRTLEVAKTGVDKIIHERIHFWNATTSNQRTVHNNPRQVGRMASFMEKTEKAFVQSNSGN